MLRSGPLAGNHLEELARMSLRDEGAKCVFAVREFRASRNARVPRYSASPAKSASRERSPRCSVMWPECAQPLKRSTTYVSPDEPSVR